MSSVDPNQHPSHELLEEAKRSIGIRSVSDEGNEEFCNYLGIVLQDLGFKVTIQPVIHSMEGISKRQFNLVGILGDSLVDRKTRKGLLLLSHLDTPPPGLLSRWSETEGDPFRGAIQNKQVIGLGAADAKLDFLCKVRAAWKFADQKLRMPIYLAGTCGEDAGMLGAKYLLQSYFLNPKYVLVGKPTSLKLVNGHKGFFVNRASVGYHVIERGARGFNRRMTLHSFGRTVHSSYASGADNAISQLVDFLNQAVENGFEMKFTRIEGGQSLTHVPDSAVAEFCLTSHQLEDFKRFFRESVKGQGAEDRFSLDLGGVGDTGIRFLPDDLFFCIMDIMTCLEGVGKELSNKSSNGEDSASEFDVPYSTLNAVKLKQTQGSSQVYFSVSHLPSVETKDLSARITRAFGEVSVKYPHMNLELRPEKKLPPLKPGGEPGNEEEEKWLEVCGEAQAEAGLNPNFGQMSFVSEAGLFQKKNYTTLVMGLGRSSGRLGEPNEGVFLEEIEKATRFYEKVIEKVCL